MKNLKNAKIHFIGIGGVSMSALAQLAMSEGAVVSGSDMSDSGFLQRLKSCGCLVYVGEDARFVDNAEIVVYSSAIRENNAELLRAYELKKEAYERYEFLGVIAMGFDKCVAIAGTHGKTTVTAMLVHILKKLNADFVGHVGGETEYGNLIINRAGGESIFLTEACEYKKSLLSLKPHIGVVLNCECEHPDCYPDLDSVLDVFDCFLDKSEIKITGDDALICRNAHISNIEYGSADSGQNNDIKIKVFSNTDCHIWSYGDEGRECGGFCVEVDEKIVGVLHVPQEGEFNRRNALYAVAVAMTLGYNFSEVAFALSSFKGVARRFEIVGKTGDAELIFDYAHHPTQIKNVLESARKRGRVLTVFQPHTYSRTAKFMNDFVEVLSACDTLLLMPTYGARERMENGADSHELLLHILSEFPEKEVYLVESSSQTVDYVKRHADDYDVVLCLGAGNIYDLKPQLLN